MGYLKFPTVRTYWSQNEIDYNYKNLFMERVFGPAVLRLPKKTMSRMKGAGNPSTKRWYIHPSDWVKITFEADRIANEKNLTCHFL